MKAKIIIGDITKAKIIQDGNGNIVFIEDDDGKHWYNEAGDYHREDGPAIEWWNGRRQWYYRGKLHRENGPAIYWSQGIANPEEWYYRGKKIECSTQIEFDRIIKMKAFW